MRFARLSTGERILLCRRAATVVIQRLRLLRRRADPEDASLGRLLERLASAEEQQLAELGRFGHRRGGAAVEEPKDLEAAVAGFFPSLLHGPGGGGIDREAGSYFAECLQEESARLYRALAEEATDEESRAFFLRAEKAHHL
jgi:hypothetical protein